MQRAFEEGESTAALESSDEEEIVEYQYPHEESAFENELKSNSSLEVHARDIRAFRAFKNALPKIKHADPSDLGVYLVNPDLNVAVTRALRRGDSIPRYFISTESKAEARWTRLKSGISEVKKTDPTRTKPEKRFHVVFVMDQTIEPNWRLLHGVLPGGYLVIPIAKAANARYNFKFMGVIERNGPYPAVRPKDNDFWKEFEVESDEEFKEAEGVNEFGVATYDYAKEKVRQAFGEETNVLANYKKLLEMARDQNPSDVAMGARALPCTVTRDNQIIELDVRTILPLRQASHGTEDLAIFKKRKSI